MSVSPKLFRRFVVGTLPAACLATLMISGCGNSSDNASTKSPANTQSHGNHDHAHPTEGPHHGHLIELGNEEYHAELVHKKGEPVTIYILDGSAKTAVPIDAPEVIINMSHEGKAEQFKLAASADAGDPSGKSSRFVAQDQHLGEDLDAKGSAAKLVVTINGKQYTGKIEQDHDHGDSSHKH
ncbi:MAG TPA: hypothetical protein VNQ76_05615 [Planctomicrobium sp.]|nr:hypothetical protein [Planctomicrobium sp.]